MPVYTCTLVSMDLNEVDLNSNVQKCGYTYFQQVD